MNKKALCIIPARGGSKRIPHKNIIDFKGKPLLSYSIKAAQEAEIFDTIMVSTDDIKIANIAKKYGAEIPFYRDPATANDHSGLVDVLLEVLEHYKMIGVEYYYVACVLATAPLLQSNNLVKAYEVLEKNEDIDSVCPVEKFSYPPQRCLVIRDEKLHMLCPENYYARSQDLEPYYHDCGQFFFFKVSALERDKKMYTQNMYPLIIDGMKSQDIDDLSDLAIASIKYDMMKKGE